MASKRGPKRRPATSDANRESQMVSLAIDLAEKQLSEGSASAMVITHYLKLGSTREKLEQERLRRENEVLNARVETLASAKKVEELYAAALDAMRSYAGRTVETEQDYYDED
ncbi:MAG: hypothetical protein ABWY25_09100 [Paenisporosarcina sp.]